ncbi:MAG: M56 family metallopeptidase [Bacteroidota bacterium]
MVIFDSSPSWIMALGRTLLHSLWAGVFFLAVLKLAFLFILPRFVLVRYRIATTWLFLFAGSMIALFLYFYDPAGGSETTVAGSRNTLLLYNQTLTVNDWLILCCYYSTYVYFTGIFFIILHTLSSYCHIRSIRKGGEPVTGMWLERFMKLKKKAGRIPDVLLLESDRIDTPFLSGFIKPAIVIPTGMIAQLPFSQVEIILVHELSHLKRLDHVVNLFQRIVEILFFYNPAFWILSRIVRKEREFCCDDMVLTVCPQPLDYARALYKLALEQRKLPSLVPAATGNHSGQLRNRIQRILNPASMKTNIREKLSAMALLTGAFLIVLIMSGFSSALSITRYNSQPDDVSGQPESSEALQVVQAVAAVEPVRSPLSAPAVQQDTVRPHDQAGEVNEEADREAIRNEMEEAREALESIDWEKIKEDMEQAKVEAMESIDWEEIRKEMEQAKVEAMESIDWEKIKEDMEQAKVDAMESIDWEEIRKEMEQAKVDAMESIDWDEIQREMGSVRIHLDSVLKNLDFYPEMHFDFDQDLDFDFDFDLDKAPFMKELEELPMKIEVRDRLEF